MQIPIYIKAWIVSLAECTSQLSNMSPISLFSIFINYFHIFNYLFHVFNKIIRSNCSFFDNIRNFPVIDPVNKIFLKVCLISLSPHEYIVLVFLLDSD